ncbi:hypothetical protein [Streptomyces sp. URMC 129]|uniref:hypothetical protein n=1 Tax=Streptomyces sp. URMC 129 TaxID=3423407 RepID=UPI003F1A6E88
MRNTLHPRRRTIGAASLTGPAPGTPGWAHPYTVTPWSPVLYGDGGDGGGDGGDPGNGDTGGTGGGDGGDPPKPPASGGAAGGTGETPEKVIARLEKQLADARQDAAKARTNAKQQAADTAVKDLTAKLLTALGHTPEGDKPPTPEQLMEQLKEKDSAAAKAAADAAASRLEALVLRTALAERIDGDRLLDSRKFLAAVEGLDASDPAKHREAIVKAIKDAAQADASLTLAPAPPASGGDLTGGTGTGGRQRPGGGLAGAIRAHYGAS